MYVCISIEYGGLTGIPIMEGEEVTGRLGVHLTAELNAWEQQRLKDLIRAGMLYISL